MLESAKEVANVHIYGLCDGVAMVQHVLACMHEGFYIVLLSLERALLGLWAEGGGGGWVGATTP